MYLFGSSVVLLYPDRWMVAYKCHRKRVCHMLSTAVYGVGRIWITITSCRQWTTASMRSAWRRRMSVSIHTTMSEWRHQVSIMPAVVFWTLLDARGRWSDKTVWFWLLKPSCNKRLCIHGHIASAVSCLKRLVFEMTGSLSSESLNSAH